MDADDVGNTDATRDVPLRHTPNQVEENTPNRATPRKFTLYSSRSMNSLFKKGLKGKPFFFNITNKSLDNIHILSTYEPTIEWQLP